MELVPISELFAIEYGNGLELNRLEILESHPAINFVSRTSKNNGVSARVMRIENEKLFDAGLITVSVGGSVLETFLQSSPFYTGYHVMVLTPKRYMTDFEKLFYCTCVKKNKYRYNYGRQANRTLKTIKIPAEVPEWVHKIGLDIPENFADSITPIKLNLDVSNWQWFRYDELFNLGKGERIVNKDMRGGTTPCIRPIESNNGVYDFIDLAPNHKGNTITINYNGSVAEAFYQPAPYFALDDVNVLYPKFNLNPFIAMFLITLIRKEKFRFNYGRKWHLGRMKESEIKLPTTPEGIPDWEFMENYIKSLPYSVSI